MGAAKKTPAKKPSAVGAPSATPAFQQVVAALRREGGIDDGPDPSPRRTFGSTGLKVNGKLFAMSVKGALVVKLPKDRVDALVASGVGTHFDPGHGRLMKEWVAVQGSEDHWVNLAREAREFVSARAR